ncbi:hypothetical protein COU96_00335 [Candidatus Shapirobacteria bacterium CG10_big_fil_rev_8_21_14_0_10_38_14]|uniref:phosphoglycerate mutase (2,3-diphosphoglycerate-dependent) n=1 Tax=Candidatus Shapirobacteria bacterium CG10_big_fil_rev_8_21_14_0_10_38_14 TaxID=1974483 RepID=A0A2M8L685_9BACT|nr:MAG: hypothetical protein COU96_00335 [Candidatus Shapirobacteria bacterium CG10_big_fil_rev_8_21_14_0_10_38_14]
MRFKVDDILKISHSAVSSILHPGLAKEDLPKMESKKYPEIYVFRHGETYDNRNRIFSGWRDSKLTPKGIRQAEVLKDKLKEKQIDICICSRLSRSKETANIIFKGRPVVFEEDNRIIERNYGSLSGKSKSKLMRKDFIKAVKYRRFYDYRPPDGESLEDVSKRVFPFCEDLIKRIRRNGENIAVSCHGNSMKTIRLFFEKLLIIDVLVQENPLGNDYAEYVVTPTEVKIGKVPAKEKRSKLPF